MKLPALAVLTLASLLVPPSAAQAKPPTCQGEPASIVGKPGASLYGTPGPDVVVTNGARYVSTSSGDDRVCVTGATKDGKRVEVYPGTDDDVIVVTGRDPVRSMLGDGADRYTGGDGTDVVWAGYTDSSFDHVDDARDVIRTGDGSDSVHVGSTDDSVSLGRGDDVLEWETVGGVADAGPGDDVAFIDVGVSGEGTWVLDNRAETLSRDGQTVLELSRFDHFSIALSGAVTVIGTNRDEVFDIVASWLRIDAGGGDDLMEGTPADDRLRGGPGHDIARGGPGHDLCRAEVRKSCER